MYPDAVKYQNKPQVYRLQENNINAYLLQSKERKLGEDFTKVLFFWKYINYNTPTQATSYL